MCFPKYLLFAIILSFGVLHLSEARMCACGVTAPSVSYIFSGDEVNDLRAYPWLVTLHRKVPREDEDPRGFCGGTLVSLNTIVTSASCLYEFYNEKDFSVGFSTKNPDWRVTNFLIKYYVLHSDYKPGSPENDIAIIKLWQNVPCEYYVRPICMNRTDLSDDELSLHLVGWESGQKNILRSGRSSIFDGYVCEEEIEGKKGKIKDMNKVICTFGQQEYACGGDAGNGAFLMIENKYFLAGVIPKRKLCPNKKPRYVTKVSNHYSFIKRYSKSYKNY